MEGDGCKKEERKEGGGWGKSGRKVSKLKTKRLNPPFYMERKKEVKSRSSNEAQIKKIFRFSIILFIFPILFV
jgi:hypothetical protein